MINVQHLAVKYRPRTLREVIGQKQVVGSIIGALRRKSIPPVILLHGPHSTGKTTIARLLAKYLNCEKPDKDHTPCEKCSSCKASNDVLAGRSVHTDVTELNAALHGGVDAIRRLESLAPQAPRYNVRIFILDEAHGITATAFRGALKLFEDPPRRAMFFLCTTDFEKLPKQIIDRCHIFKLTPIDTDLIAKRVYQVAIKEGFKPGNPKMLKKLCQQIGAASDGHMRQALGLLDNIRNYAEGQEGSINWDKMLPEIIENTPELAPYVTAQRYVAAIFSGKHPRAFLAIDNTQNHDYLVRRVLECFDLIVSSWIDEEHLVDRGKYWMLRGVHVPSKDVGKKVLLQSDGMEEIMTIYLDALDRIKNYTTDPKVTVQAATLRVMKIIRSWNKLSKS